MSTEASHQNNYSAKVSGWLDKYRDGFGNRILCIGLPGDVLRHLARLMPSASIACLTGVPSEAGDPQRSAPAPDKDGILRIPSSLDTYKGGLFDSVICLDEAPLFPNSAPEFPSWRRGTFYFRRASLLMDYYESRAHALCSHVREGGRFFSLVRSDHDEYLLGWCLALAAEGAAIDLAGLRQILCVEDGSRTVLQGVCGVSGARMEITPLLAENLNFSLDRMNSGAEELRGKDADILLQADASGLLRGYSLYLNEPDGSLYMGKMGIYSSASREDVLYYYTCVSGDDPWLRRFHTDDRDRILRHMTAELHRQKASNKIFGWKEFTLSDNWSEEDMPASEN